MYKITSLNTEDNSVSVLFEHNGHSLNHTSFANDVTDDEKITQVVEKDFDAFKAEIECLSKHEDLPAEVEALVGATVETEE